ncbi:hypothetical protein pv_219 [Pithovirus sibericum]|uniref:Uncharacterized protein n=1 Tax=Pithovirus sibericum TaxID=1450746 RepID=W5S4Y9_9VIRU|nr:hypothetical protein pv_219 [Pithovirus sibericum]AHH01786.1 hypothetical protein pv_219 [Pithovirus sibericum]WIL05361.1 hypothetical protein pmam_322 [Pithovirus mammoth]
MGQSYSFYFFEETPFEPEGDWPKLEREQNCERCGKVAVTKCRQTVTICDSSFWTKDVYSCAKCVSRMLKEQSSPRLWH